MLSKFITLICCSFILAGCATVKQLSSETKSAISGEKIKKTTHAHYAPINPTAVLLTAIKPSHVKYQSIGSIEVSLYNFVGNKRQQATINDLLQEGAAKIGGNAVVNIHQNKHVASGEIVRLFT